MTSNHHAPYVLGHTRTTMAVNRGRQNREVEQIPKSRPSSDCRLKLACTKLASLVIADQHAAVNALPGRVHTDRHTTRVVCTRSRRPPRTKRTFDSVLLAVRLPASGTPHSDGVTGGVYKARERIHRAVLMRDY